MFNKIILFTQLSTRNMKAISKQLNNPVYAERTIRKILSLSDEEMTDLISYMPQSLQKKIIQNLTRNDWSPHKPDAMRFLNNCKNRKTTINSLNAKPFFDIFQIIEKDYDISTKDWFMDPKNNSMIRIIFNPNTYHYHEMDPDELRADLIDRFYMAHGKPFLEEIIQILYPQTLARLFSLLPSEVMDALSNVINNSGSEELQELLDEYNLSNGELEELPLSNDEDDA
ncbi:hypothetical protein ACFL5G_05830 [Candidatus Margulisiibacteriota bacterium]